MDRLADVLSTVPAYGIAANVDAERPNLRSTTDDPARLPHKMRRSGRGVALAALYGEFDCGFTKGRPKGAACGSYEILRPRASGRRFVERTAQFAAH